MKSDIFRPMEDILKQYPCIVEQKIVWGEMDAFAHINNVAYFRYFETARIAYFEKVGVMEVMETTGIGPILHSTDCRYKIPLVYPDTVYLCARITRLEKDRYNLEHCVVSKKHQKVAAIGNGLCVCFNYEVQSKSEVPLILREKILDFQRDCPPEIVE